MISGITTKQFKKKTQLTTMVTEGTGTQQKTVSCFHLSSIHPSIHPSWCGGGVAGSLSSGPFLLLHSARLISRWLGLLELGWPAF
jgi:hypothetical protein